MSFFRVALLSVALASPLFGQGYSFQTLATIPPSTETRVMSINNNGAIVGWYLVDGLPDAFGFKQDAAGVLEYPISDPFVYIGTWATGINQNGKIVGYFQGHPNGHKGVHGFVAGGVNGPFFTVDIRPGPWTAIYGVNNRGDFAGGTGKMYAGADLLTHGFISINGTITRFDAPGVTWTTAHGIASDDSVVGETYDGVAFLSFVRGPKGNLLRFAADQAPPNGWTFAYGINNTAGIIVGSYFDATGNSHGFIYRYVDDLVSLGDVSGTSVKTVPVQTLDYPGATYTELTGVNAKGVIVGNAGFQDFSRVSFIATPD